MPPAPGAAAATLAEALWAQPACLRALCALPARAPGCAAAQDACAVALRAAVRAAAAPGHVAALLECGAQEALAWMERGFRDADAPERARAAALLAAQLARHPAHPERAGRAA